MLSATAISFRNLHKKTQTKQNENDLKHYICILWRVAMRKSVQTRNKDYNKMMKRSLSVNKDLSDYRKAVNM